MKTELPKRKRNRKFGFDYTSNEIYFITTCTEDKIHFFGKIKNGQMILNENGKIIENQIYWLENQYPYVEIHNFVVMPNHIHLLFDINADKVENNKVKSVSSLMGALKTTSSKEIHLNGCSDFFWQRSFHDRIVRDAHEYENIYHYISENPKRWGNDVHNPDKNNDDI